MNTILLIVSLLIQVIAILMVLYAFGKISQSRFPKLAALEKYHLMRRRCEHLRWSLLFVGALIAVQLVGVLYYMKNYAFPLTGLIISDLVVIALMIFLTPMYKGRARLEDMPLSKKARK